MADSQYKLANTVTLPPRKRAAAIVVKGNKILLIRRVDKGNEFWIVPGGGVEEGESVETAVMRELKEETSVETTLGEKLMDFVGEEWNNQHLVYKCEYVSGEPKSAPDSVEALNPDKSQVHVPEWVEISRLPQLTLHPPEIKEFLVEYCNAS